MEYDTHAAYVAATRRTRRRALFILAMAVIGALLGLAWRMQAHAETVDGSRFMIIDGDTVD